MEATNCERISAAYDAAYDFICHDAMMGSIAFVITHIAIGAVSNAQQSKTVNKFRQVKILCFLNLVAAFAWLMFQKPYKPYNNAYNSPVDTLIAISERKWRRGTYVEMR